MSLLPYRIFWTLALSASMLEAKKPSPPAEAANPTAASVLILVNRAVPPQTGTDGMGASEWVGASYAEKRGIPKRNIIRLDIPNTEDPMAWDSWHLNWDRFDEWIRKPLLKKLKELEKSGKGPIHYIVTTWGFPSHLDLEGKGYSMDAQLAALRSGNNKPMANPYRGAKVPFAEWKNPAGWPMYLVTRLDGATPQLAVGLVDKAMRAEQSLQKGQGIAYIDARGLACCDGYYVADRSMYRLRDAAEKQGIAVVFDEKQELIQKAPGTLWAWGWYGPPTEAYEFLEGAVGAQLTSYTAGSLRYPYQGNWVEHWVRHGITATWGAAAEPTTAGYANADELLGAFWSGYNFAESSYIASPMLNQTMVFVGDPLYAPKAFRKESR